MMSRRNYEKLADTPSYAADRAMRFAPGEDSERRMFLAGVESALRAVGVELAEVCRMDGNPNFDSGRFRTAYESALSQALKVHES